MERVFINKRNIRFLHSNRRRINQDIRKLNIKIIDTVNGLRDITIHAFL